MTFTKKATYSTHDPNTVSVDTTVGRQSTDIAVDIAAAISTEATYSTHDPKILAGELALESSLTTERW